eukprot:861348_1
MYTLKEYQKFIINKTVFYDILGFMITDPMIDFIKTHAALYDKVNSDVFVAKKTKVITRLVQELDINDELLVERERVASTTNVDCIHHDWTRCLELKFKTSGPGRNECTLKDIFESSQYKMVPHMSFTAQDLAVYFEYDGNSAFINMEQFVEGNEYDVFIKNVDFFGINAYILCSQIQMPTLDKTCPFYDTLKVMYYGLIQVANIKDISGDDQPQIIASQYVLVKDRNPPVM